MRGFEEPGAGWPEAPLQACIKLAKAAAVCEPDAMSRVWVWIGGWCGLLGAAALAASAPAPSPEQPAWLLSAKHSPSQPRSGEPVQITAQVQPGVARVTLQCQVVEPGAYVELKSPAYQSNWVSWPMQPETNALAGTTFTAQLPASLQRHRQLVRYRFLPADAPRPSSSAPAPDAIRPNFAYFVYDGIPAWTAAIQPSSQNPRLSARITFSPEAMRRVQAYHLLGRKSSIENATWREQDGGKDYRYTGTLVADGVVYDHIRYRARGGVWRYAMGKNMWKFDLPTGQRLAARDDFGRPYPVAWNKVNLRSCIQQADYGMRGEQGLFEAVGFRLFNLAGVAAPHTHWIQLRIIDEPEENPADQYRGDFWGLYLAIENEDGRFLKAHDLPDGNLYKMSGGSGELSHQGTGAAADGADLDRFIGAYSGGPRPETWWRTNLNLPCYYSYRAICECIHHYDIGEGKNYDYYHNPATGQWQVIPWDIDLTWADYMYGGGEEPFKSHVLARPIFRLDYQNRLRELRDLLFNPEQAGQLIDEYAAVIRDPAGTPSLAEADRRKWDYHPAMAMGGKAGQGLFYRAAPTTDLPGMVRLMKTYVQSRGAWIDAHLLNDPKIPAQPVATYTGAPNFPAAQLRFRASPYQGASPFAARKWRLAEITPTKGVPVEPGAPRRYEITPVWESAELAAEEIVVPEGAVRAGHSYRARMRVKDLGGRWSHWSMPVEFVASR
jgi:hypothetical protein